MKNTFGNSVTVTLFGESHGESVGAVLDGIAAGLPVDIGRIANALSRRRPDGVCSSARIEEDEFEIVSGVYNGFTTGAPLTVIIKNKNINSSDYAGFSDTPRPGHSDYSAYCKYRGFADYRGGGHFSGRLTAPLVAVGSVLNDALNGKGIYIGTHVSRLAGISDRSFQDLPTDICKLNGSVFPVLCAESEESMKARIKEAKAEGDSVGGILESAIIGLPSGLGEPFFDSFESSLSHILFSVPAVKGVSFGDGFTLADMKGSEANDAFIVKGGTVTTETLHNGGVLGGITVGTPVIFSAVVKPTPSIAKEQNTVSLSKNENTKITASGRHDPAIAPRCAAVIDAVTAIAVADMLTVQYGRDYLAGGKAL